MEVHLGLASRDQFGQRLPDPAGAAEPVQRQPGGYEQPLDTGDRPHQRVRVRRHGIGMADELHDARLADEGKAPRRSGQQWFEATLVGSDRCPGVVPGHAVDPARDGVQFVAAQDDAARLGLAIDEVVGVAEARHVLREFRAHDREQRGVLVIDRRRDDEGPSHGGHLRRPDAAGDDDNLRFDPAGRCLHRLHRASRGQLDPGHPRVREDPHAQRARGVCQREGGGVRIEGAIARQPDRAKERIGADRGHQLGRLLGRDQLDVEPDGAGATHAPLLLQQLFAAGREAQAAHGLENPQLPVQLDAVATEPHHGRGRVELGDQTRRMAGRSTGQVGFLQQDRVSPASPRQVVGHAGAGDPSPDDDGARTAR